MAKSGKIELYKGVSKKTGKDFTALRLSVGEWDELYFPKGKFDMKYIEQYLAEPDETDELFTPEEKAELDK